MSAPRIVLSGLSDRTMWRRTRTGSFSVNRLRAVTTADLRKATVDFTDATIIGFDATKLGQPFSYQGSVANLDITGTLDGTALTPIGQFLMPSNGWLSSLSLQYTDVILSGTLSVALMVNGVVQGTIQSLSPAQQKLTFDLGKIPFNLGDTISFNIQTNTLSPIGPQSHLIVQLYYVLQHEWLK